MTINVYPSSESVEAADREQLGRWQRFLRSPQDDTETIRLRRICERFRELGGWTPELSKKVGR